MYWACGVSRFKIYRGAFDTIALRIEFPLWNAQGSGEDLQSHILSHFVAPLNFLHLQFLDIPFIRHDFKVTAQKKNNEKN